MGRDRRAEAAWAGHQPSTVPMAGAVLGAGTAVAVAIVCHEWLLHANQSAMAIFNPKF